MKRKKKRKQKSQLKYCLKVDFEKFYFDVPGFTLVPTEAEARRAAVVVQRFCNSRQGNTLCVTCPIRDICGVEPYTWVLPCTDCGKDSEPRIKCRYKGPVCVACCEACHNAEPFPCPDYDNFRKRVTNGDL